MLIIEGILNPQRYRRSILPPIIPEKVAEALKDVHQGFEAELSLGTSIKGIIDGGSLMDHLRQGFGATLKATYLQDLKRFYKEPVAQRFFDTYGPALSLGVNADIDLTFDDEEDIEDNPIIGKFVRMTFDEGLGLLGQDPQLIRAPLKWPDVRKVLTD